TKSTVIQHNNSQTPQTSTHNHNSHHQIDHHSSSKTSLGDRPFLGQTSLLP
ncbi:hypothetical protein ILUMI_26080, partial [Ignelater luminosus]